MPFEDAKRFKNKLIQSETAMLSSLLFPLIFFFSIHNADVHLFNLIAEQNIVFVSCVEQTIYQSVLYIFLLQKCAVAFNSGVTVMKSRQITSVSSAAHTKHQKQLN